MLLGSVVALACAASERVADDERTTITVLTYGGVRELGYVYDMPAQHLMFLPLVSTGRDGEIQGRLARSWEHSADGWSWTYHLRTDVRWHDGVPVTAEDVAFTLALLSHPEVLWSWMPGDIDVTVHDDSTLTIAYLNTSKNPLNDYQVFYPKHLLADLDPAQMGEWEFWERPVGNGPYRYVRHVPKVVVELEANPDFFAGKPRIDRVLLRFGGSSDVTDLLAGNADVRSWPGSYATVQALADDSRFRVYYPVEERMTAIWWNHRSPFFADARVRRALAMSIDRASLGAVNRLPADLSVMWDVPATARQLGRRDVIPPLPYDPAHARALLDSAGWRDRDGDGVRERAGLAFRFTALTGQANRNAVVVQDQFAQVGVGMELQAADFGVVRRRIREGEFEAAFHRFPDHASKTPWLGPESVNGYRNPAFEERWHRARATWDPDARDSAFRAAMGMFQADMPLTILYHSAQPIVAHRRVRGLATPYRGIPLMYMDELWIEDEP